jgi:pilus assembly protein CpaB
MLTAALAFLLAVLGTIGVLAYVRQANIRALNGMKAVSVLVAKDGIPSGTTASSALRDGLLAQQRLPASSVPPNALHSIAGLGSLVTSSAMQPGQLLLRLMLVQKAQATAGIAIPLGKMAVTVQLCVPEAVAGNVKAGSSVAVFDTYTKSGGQITAQANCSGPHEQQAAPQSVHTQLVLKKVLVLSIGQVSAGGLNGAVASVAAAAAGASQNEVLVTMAVDQADAERLIQMTETGLPYLGLLTSSSSTSFSSAPVPLFQSPQASLSSQH